MPARALFLMIGASPNTEWLSDLVELDNRGFVKTGKTVGAERPFETSRQGIFAIGDVRAGSVKRVASAAGEGGSRNLRVSWRPITGPTSSYV